MNTSMVTDNEAVTVVRPELLAPAGNKASCLAALAAGADAVYMGLKHFSARMQASNFAVKETLALCALAHARDAKVYVAFNTLLKPGDLGAACRLLERLARAKRDGCGPDALIVQDLGALEAARQVGFPGELHLSTLAAATPAASLALADRLGVRRVVLPRELDIDEIRMMAQACPPEMSLETFVHGALCYAVSGRCWWSSALGGKSGLRGRCVQPCRRVYDKGLKGHKERFFSCLDLGLDILIKTLLDIPQVRCWKIEGRKKGPHYVFYTTTAYRMLRDEGRDPAIRKEAVAILEKALSRATTKARFLPQSRQIPFAHPKEARQTGSGLFVGAVKHTPEGGAVLEPRIPLLAHDVLRIGTEDETHHRVLKLQKPVPKRGRFDILPETDGRRGRPGPPAPRSRPGKPPHRGKGPKGKGPAPKTAPRGRKALPLRPRGLPPSGAPVFLVDRREPELNTRLRVLETELAALEASEAAPNPGTSRFEPRLPAPIAPSGPLLDLFIRRSPPKGKASRPAGQLGYWVAPRLLDQISRTLLPKHWWHLPPVIWPDEERMWRLVVERMVKGGARRFILGAVWQLGLFPPAEARPALELVAGPHCNIANGFHLAMLQELGVTAAVVSPELGQDDYLALPAQSPLPLGVTAGGYWPACLSRHIPPAVKNRDLLASPKGEVYWARVYGQNLWLFPHWPVDMRAHRQALEQAGYRLFLTYDETPPAPSQGAGEIPERTTEMNWEVGLL